MKLKDAMEAKVRELKRQKEMELTEAKMRDARLKQTLVQRDAQIADLER